MATPRKKRADKEGQARKNIGEELPHEGVKREESIGFSTKRPSLEGEILLRVAEYFGVSKEDILSHSRKKEFALARHITMYLLHSIKGVSLTKLGKMFDRDHTSILYAAEKIKTLLERHDPQIELHLDTLGPS